MAGIPFEEKTFVTLRHLAERWECSIDYILNLESKGILTFFYPEYGGKVRRVRVKQVLEVERRGCL